MERRLFGAIPSSPRCKLCRAPFEGLGGRVMRTVGLSRWPKNPSLCRGCFGFAEQIGLGGVEIPMSMLFADIRGSTTLAEGLSPSAFRDLLHRFYQASFRVLVEANAWIDKVVGDEVVAFFVPGMAGDRHAGAAIESGEKLLRDVSRFLPVGAGVHTGVAFMGGVGGDGHVHDVTALGDAVNVTARLASMAAAGELLVSDDAWRAAGRNSSAEIRSMRLKGREEAVAVRVLRVDAA